MNWHLTGDNTRKFPHGSKSFDATLGFPGEGPVIGKLDNLVNKNNDIAHALQAFIQNEEDDSFITFLIRRGHVN